MNEYLALGIAIIYTASIILVLRGARRTYLTRGERGQHRRLTQSNATTIAVVMLAVVTAAPLLVVLYGLASVIERKVRRA